MIGAMPGGDEISTKDVKAVKAVKQQALVYLTAIRSWSRTWGFAKVRPLMTAISSKNWSWRGFTALFHLSSALLLRFRSGATSSGFKKGPRDSGVCVGSATLHAGEQTVGIATGGRGLWRWCARGCRWANCT